MGQWGNQGRKLPNGRTEAWKPGKAGRNFSKLTSAVSVFNKKKVVGNNSVRESRRMFQKRRRVRYREKICKLVTLWSGRNSRNSCPTCRHTFCCLLTVLDAHGWLTYIGLPPAAASPTHCLTQSPFSVFHTHRHARKSWREGGKNQATHAAATAELSHLCC